MNVAEEQREPLELGAVAGKRVRRPRGLEVERVAAFAEPVRGFERVGVVRFEEPGRAEARERVDRLRHPEVDVLAAVDELEELHGELDVGQRAPPELEVELRVLARRDALAFDARLHAAHLAHVVVGERSVVGELVDELAEPRPELGVAGDEAAPW